MAQYQQTVTIQVTVDESESEYGERVDDAVLAAVRFADGVDEVDLLSVGERTRLQSSPNANKEKLIALAAWAGGEHAKQRLGLPSEWDQAHWFSKREGVGIGGFCGTAGCLAGKQALEEGWRIRMFEGKPDDFVSKVVDGQQVEEFAATVAREALGLSSEDADRLFEADNNYDDVLRIIGELIAD